MMWERYQEPLSLNDMADSAQLSRFHFARVFRGVTGTSPRRFLSAIRLSSAKRLLINTTLSVTDIAFMVGYNSLGTFTTRFHSSVGLTPTEFRAYARGESFPLLPPRPNASRQLGAVHGKMFVPRSGTAYRIYVGVFSSALVEGMPVSCDVLDSPADGCRVHDYQLDAVPVGDWHIRSVAVALHRSGADPRPWTRLGLVGDPRPVTLRAGDDVEIDFEMRDLDVTDLPILLALPDLDYGDLPDLTSIRSTARSRDLRLSG
ncbi:AraC family transcriptional regulator [Actinoplanes capillaceus]|uniref:AraC family transcriptional regulator n=1 Tax=Actinoplanes campanulatus TaxID=113559 RepID=A0ABQ3WSF7_9ACTN|nr:helix-turn-helix transcriptional regulator [Actinoplanes capillaceus]GID49222.1 AraC family transcriptional regulator [Actinoplanes capillaceus]